MKNSKSISVADVACASLMLTGILLPANPDTRVPITTLEIPIEANDTRAVDGKLICSEGQALDLGATDTTSLRKIEELTLYTQQQQEAMERQTDRTNDPQPLRAPQANVTPAKEARLTHVECALNDN